MIQFNDFLINYWKPILCFILALCSIIIAGIRKRPISDILTDIYYYSIKAVNDVEAESKVICDLKGYDKLELAVLNVLNALSKRYPSVKFDRYKKLIASIIEDLLTTPQKKGGNNG